jgi:type II secretory pathway component PulC
MKQLRPVQTLLVLCTAVIWIATVYTAHSIASSHSHSIVSETPADESAFSTSFAEVEKALHIRPKAPAPRYDGTFEIPFRNASEARLPEGNHMSTPASVSRPRLVLKGILFKSNPLSILADETGATFILGVGDTLGSQKIVSIGKTTVTVKDKRGTYDLTVKE